MDFVKGDQVRLVADPAANVGVVTEVLLGGDSPQYEVMFESGGRRVFGAHALVSDAASGVSSESPDELLARGAWVGADDFRGFMTLAKLRTPLSDNLYSFAASRTERLPHQFKGVLKLLGNPHGRLLIADEVGLGKTIEAGIIITELAARGPLNNILIVCPSPLKEKWRSEMRERFLLDFEVATGGRLREAIEESAKSAIVEPLRMIASIELLRREENVEHLGEQTPPFDLVIVDEAHHMRNPGTKANALGDLLGELAERMIFLTATPLNLGREDFFELMRLLLPGEFPDSRGFAAIIEPNRHLNAALRRIRATKAPDFAAALDDLQEVEATAQGNRFANSHRYAKAKAVLERGAQGEQIDREAVVACQRDLIELNTLSQVFTRTRKREVQELFPTRRSQTFSVEFTAREKQFYDAVTEWTLREYEDRAAHLVVITFQRMAASCLPALGRRLAAAHRDGRITLTQDEIPEVAEEVGDDGELEEAGPTTVEIETNGGIASEVAQLLRTWELYDGTTDSKYEAFEEALSATFSEGADRVLVFSYFTATIDYLATRLDGLEVSGRPLKVLRLYGPMSQVEREAAVERFRNDPGPVVLISSEVGSEGLDFQFCSRMFNYDLPWNPMRVEQRIGRLDRYGQASDLIQILNMIVADTVEERIFMRLYDRIRIFEESIGDLEAILGGVETDLARLQREALTGRLTPEEQEKRSDQIADIIINNQQENEIFEEDAQQLLSNDDVFLDLFNDIESSRKYVTPEELHSLVDSYLRENDFPVALKPVAGEEGVYDLIGDVEAFLDQIVGLVRRHASNAREGRAFIVRLEPGVRLTFDPRVATVDRKLEFVSLKHPLIEVIARERGDYSESSCGLLELPLGGSAGDENLFFVFELKAEGVKDTIEFAGVVVGEDGQVDETASSMLLSALDEARTGSAPESPDETRVESAAGAARAHVSAIVAAMERDLQESVDEMVAARVESLRLSTEHRMLRLRELIETVSSESIVRMYTGQLRRLERDYEERREEIAQRRGVTVSYRLVAAGVAVDSGESVVTASSN